MNKFSGFFDRRGPALCFVFFVFVVPARYRIADYFVKPLFENQEEEKGKIK